MKRINLTLINQKKLFAFWILFHAVILLAFAGVWLFAGDSISLSADLFNLLPKTFSEESVNMADELLTSGTNKNVFILVTNEDFSEAKKAAEAVYSKLSESVWFDSLTLYTGDDTVSQATDFILSNKWNLLDEATIETVQQEGVSYLSEQALSRIFGGFTLISLDNLEEDPYLLSEIELNDYLEKIQQSGVGLTAVDGVLAQQQEGRWYIMLRGILNEKGAAMASRKNGITEIYDVCSANESNGTRFIFSGTPFHSHESSSSASREILIISIVSLTLMLVILLLVFRSPVPILCSLSAIILSSVTAFLGTLAIFKSVHVIALVFGTSLIGSCIDYSLHYFVHWAGNSELKTGLEIRNHVFKGLVMAIASSGISFIVLLFAPFALLKQIAVFCLLGLFSSFLTTIAVYPFINLPCIEKRTLPLKRIQLPSGSKGIAIVKKAIPAVLLVFSAVTIGLFYRQTGVKNNISSLYKMSDKMLADEIEAAKVIQYSPTGWFILRAGTEQELIEKEEAFSERYKALDDVPGYICTSLFIPSIKKQQQSRDTSRLLLENVEEHLSMLGFDEDSFAISRNSFAASESQFLTVSNCPELIGNVIQNCWLGEINGEYYSVFIPSRITDESPLRSLADGYDDIFFVNKSSDISKDLDRLSFLILILFGCSLVIIFILTKSVYSWKESLKIISVPLFVILMIFAIFGMLSTKLEFFSITGVVLVFGLGLDYILYMTENTHKDDSEGNSLEPFAIMLSFITSLISFGSLSLSSFQPVHLIGLSICIGLSTAYVCSLSK